MTKTHSASCLGYICTCDSCYRCEGIIKYLRAEIARYREALEYISKTDTRDAETEDLVIWLNDWRNYTKQIAREALKGGE